MWILKNFSWRNNSPYNKKPTEQQGSNEKNKWSDILHN
jgi:hypothetical protein